MAKNEIPKADFPEAHAPTQKELDALHRTRRRLIGADDVEAKEEYDALDNAVRLLTGMKVQPDRKPTRTRNASIMLVLAALENGDLYLRSCELPVIGGDDGTARLTPGGPYDIGFDGGNFRFVVRYRVDPRDKSWVWDRMTTVYLDNGQAIVVQPPYLNWLLWYRPTPFLDNFSPLVQLSLNDYCAMKGELPVPQVVNYDTDGFVYRWVNDEVQKWKDQKGRLL